MKSFLIRIARVSGNTLFSSCLVKKNILFSLCPPPFFFFKFWYRLLVFLFPIDRNLLKRSNPDITLDTRGKDLLDLCVSHQIRVLSGRVLGDMLGHYTCCTPNGASVVDYVMMLEGILDQGLYFKVTNFSPTLADTHCKLEWTMSAKFVS